MKQLANESNTKLERIYATENNTQEHRRHEQVSKFVQAAEHIITSKTLGWSSWNFFSRQPKAPADIQDLNKLVDDLLATYKNYFNDLVVREAWKESQCINKFKKIAEEVLDTDVENYNWTRIAMLLALACRMAKHCYNSGSSIDFVTKFARAVGLCIEERVNSWTRPNRWEGLQPRAAEGKTYKQLLGFGTVIVSAVVTIMGLTQSSSAVSLILKN